MRNYDQKKKIEKASRGIQFNGSTLTSLSPAYSVEQNPIFNNTLQLEQNSKILKQLEQDYDNQKFNTGLNLSMSSDPTAQQYGQQLVQNEMGQLNQSLSNSLQENSTNIPGVNLSISAGLDAASSVVGAIPGQVGQIGSSVLKGVSAIKNGVDMFKNASKAAKDGIKGASAMKGGSIATIGGAVADLAGSFLPEKTEYAGDKGGITQTMDSVYDGISDAAMSFGPIGMMVGGIMKGGKLLGGVMNSINGGTDGKTTIDAILGSSFLNLTPIGLINGFGGQKAETITKNELAFEQVGPSYTGTGRAVDDALKNSGSKYGLLSNGARKKANEEILEARRQQNVMSNIADNAADRFSIRDSMAAINSNRRKLQMQGGYDQSAIRVGRYGMIIQDLQRAKKINSTTKYQKGEKMTDQPQFFKEGGSLAKYNWLAEVDLNNISLEFRGEDLEEVDLDSILPEFKEGGKFNLIPEGALHARKHNMDVEGITPKGIPVVSEAKGGELEQQAEIEREEIIFRLEVTKKIEELAKDGSDEAAIEAGRLLVKEILYNTIDNTNNLL